MIISTTKSLILVIIFVCATTIAKTDEINVVTYLEGEITLPTYYWGERAYPKFIELNNKIYYPYPEQDIIDHSRKENRTYQAYFLENQYLKITCLPELNGRIHSIVDKTTGKEIIYRNDTIKPNLIGLRGAWEAGGIEWNAGPKKHTVTCLLKANVLPKKNNDGSTSLWIGTIEKIFRTQWSVKLTLYPNKAYIEEEIKIENRTDHFNPYYFWNTVSFPDMENTKFIFPVSLVIHQPQKEFLYLPWPIHEDIDYRYLKNYEKQRSLYLCNSDYDFFGLYNPDWDLGLVHVSDHNVLTGKKAWTWGTSYFETNKEYSLNDDDSLYIEIQSGPLQTQEECGELLPRQNVTWKEWWFPVHGLKDGYEFATKDIVIQRIKDNQSNELSTIFQIYATDDFPSALITVSNNNQILHEKRVDLSPLTNVNIPVNSSFDESLTIHVQSSNGRTLAEYRSPLEIRDCTAPSPNWIQEKPYEDLSTEEMYLKGKYYDTQIDRVAARTYYELALEKDPNYTLPLKSLAILDIESGNYAKAEELLKKAVIRNPNDGYCWYYLGIVTLALGNYNQTLDYAKYAIKDTETERLGQDLIGRAYLNLKKYYLGESAFRTVYEMNPNDFRARDYWLISLYAAGLNELACKESMKVKSENPLELIPRVILYFLDKESRSSEIDEIVSFVGDVEFKITEISILFFKLGLVEEAKEILKVACYDSPMKENCSPIVVALLSYLEKSQNHDEKSMALLDEISQYHRDFVFPSRPETIDVLKYAIHCKPNDAYLSLYLGNLYAGLGRLDEAVEQWTMAIEKKPLIDIALRNLGLYYWKYEGDNEKAEKLYKQATEITDNKKENTLKVEYMNLLYAMKKYDEANLIKEKVSSN